MGASDAGDAMIYQCVGQATPEPGPDRDSVERRWMRTSRSAYSCSSGLVEGRPTSLVTRASSPSTPPRGGGSVREWGAMSIQT